MAEHFVQRLSRAAPVPPDADLCSWVDCALQESAAISSVTIRVVDEDEARQLNHKYRDRDHATNVLSFVADFPPERALADLGDLVICAPVVAREALAQGKALADHWAHLVIHGTLHLRGFEHTEPDAARQMEALEVKLLAALEIPDPY